MMIDKERLGNYPAITPKELEEAAAQAVRQTRAALVEFGEAFKGIYSEHNFYSKADNCQWTNGFWTGELWLAYELTGEEDFRRTALKHTESFRIRLEQEIETDTHDLGFLYTPSCVAAYKLTGDVKSRETALLAARKLASRFHEKGQFIQAWGSMEERENYRLIIDCLLNLPLLFWASEETGDPMYANIAKAHLDSALKVVVRSDFSTYHTYYFDPDTGQPLKGVTHQGYSAESVWARGQAWGVYGIALGYRYTGKKEYLPLFESVANYFLEHLPDNLIPYWDFTFSEGSLEPRDSSAAAIAACGFLEMADLLDSEKAMNYRKKAMCLMKALHDVCAVKEPSISNGQLLHGVSGRKTPYNDCIDHGIDECNLWGDYYYMEALVRLSKKWRPYW